MAKPKAKKPRAKPKPTWAGRLPGGLAKDAWDFLHSLPHDRFLWPYDVEGTIGHVHGLEAANLVTKPEATALKKELRSIKGRPELIEDSDEDVHSAIERVLTERLGDVGAKVHTGRSRNDQVATALRLWAKDVLGGVHDAVAKLIAVLATQAEEHAATLAPGYTHLQRAQPVTIGHWLCAHGFAFARDLERLAAARSSADVSPLGAGALATSTLRIDPAVAQAQLGFGEVFSNSIDAVSDRDFLADGAYACSMALVHLSRLAEEIVLWSSSEFAFVKLPDRYATGSSMMPQKKNPDVAELARGTSGIAVGALTGLLVTMKSLPLAYDRDLQTDKQHVREVFSVTKAAFDAMGGLMGGLKFDEARLREAVSDPSLLATDVAEDLVRGGTPFRAAHEEVAKAFRKKKTTPPPRSAARVSVRARSTSGGPSKDSVQRQVAKLRRAMSS
ncbi:MAG: argininosuccinate lyase [Actinomycetota bacterium]